MEPDSERPIYTQIIERITLDIISGIYAPGCKAPVSKGFGTERRSKSQHHAKSSFRALNEPDYFSVSEPADVLSRRN